MESSVYSDTVLKQRWANVPYYFIYKPQRMDSYIIVSVRVFVLLGQFSTMYPSCPEVFHAHLDEIVDSMPSLQSHMKSCIIALLWEIAKIHPEVKIHYRPTTIQRQKAVTIYFSEGSFERYSFKYKTPNMSFIILWFCPI